MKTALAVMVGTLAMAGTAHSETELGVGLYKMDSSRDVDNDVRQNQSGPSLRRNALGSRNCLHRCFCRRRCRRSFDASLFQVDGLYHFDKQGGWEPYLAAGVWRFERF